MNKKGASWAIWAVVGTVLVIIFILMMVFLIQNKVKPVLLDDKGEEFFGTTGKAVFSDINEQVKEEVVENVRWSISKSIS